MLDSIAHIYIGILASFGHCESAWPAQGLDHHCRIGSLPIGGRVSLGVPYYVESPRKCSFIFLCNSPLGILSNRLKSVNVGVFLFHFLDSCIDFLFRNASWG